MEEQESTEQKPESKPSPVELVLDLLEWLAKVWVPLGAMLIAIAALYWVEFIKLYALPVDFSSSGTLSGLPALAAVVAALVGVLALSAIAPALVLVYPINSDGMTLIQMHLKEASKAKHLRQGGDLIRRWVLNSLALTITWPAVVWWIYKYPGGEHWIWIVFGALMVIAYVFILSIYWRHRSGKSVSLDFTMMFIAAIAAQMLLAYSVFYVAANTLPNTQSLTLLAAFFLCLIISVALSVAQLSAAVKIAKGWSAGSPKWVVLVALVTMALPLAYPPLGGAIASVPFRVSADGGSSCVVLVAPNVDEKTAWADIMDTAHPGHTLPLGFATKLDGAYYIKLTTNPATHMLPAAMVTEVVGCSKPAPKVAPPQAQPSPPQATTEHPDGNMALAALLTSIGSAIAAFLAVFYTVRLWRKTNRPLVTARIATHSGGNVGITLDILVENAGSRPALDVRLCAKREDVRAAMATGDGNADIQRDANSVFFSDVTIPVLPNGRTMSNAFGALGEGGDWRAGARIPIEVHYSGMDGACFVETGVLLLHDDAGFAQTSWDGPGERNIGHRSVTVIEPQTA